MGKAKHTRGRWTVHEGIDYIVVLRPDDSTETGIRVDNIDDAKLIAGSPRLLAAATKVLAGLNERIEMAIRDGSKSVPVFDGIAELVAAIAATE